MRVTTSEYEKKRQKLTFAQSKRFPPKDNLFVRENNSLEQAAFWHEVEVVCCLAHEGLYTKLSSRNFSMRLMTFKSACL